MIIDNADNWSRVEIKILNKCVNSISVDILFDHKPLLAQLIESKPK